MILCDTGVPCKLMGRRLATMSRRPNLSKVPDAPPGDGRRPSGTHTASRRPSSNAPVREDDVFSDPPGKDDLVDVPLSQVGDVAAFEQFLRAQGTAKHAVAAAPTPSSDGARTSGHLSSQQLRDVDMTLAGLTSEQLAECVTDAPVELSDDEAMHIDSPSPIKPQLAHPDLRSHRPPITKENFDAGDFHGLREPQRPCTPFRGRARAASIVPPGTPKVLVKQQRSGSEAPTQPVFPSPSRTVDGLDLATGRLNAAEEELLSEAATRIYGEIHELAYELRRKPDLIINRINALTGSKIATKKTIWNYYQSYFARNKDVEHARLGTQEPTKREFYLSFVMAPAAHLLIANQKHLNAFIRHFTDNIGDKWAEFLILDYDVHHIEAPITVGEQERTFRALASNVTALVRTSRLNSHYVLTDGSPPSSTSTNGRTTCRHS